MIVTMSRRMSAIRRGLTPQVLATKSLHRLCTFMEHTETIPCELKIEQEGETDLCIEDPVLSTHRGGSHSGRTR